MRLRHLQWVVVVLAVAMAVGFPAFRRGRRARAAATVLAMGPPEVEAALVLDRPVLQDALADPLYHLADRPGLAGSTDLERALAKAVHATPRAGTNLIEIAAEADRRDDATAMVDAVLVAYLRTRPSSSVHVVQNTTAVSAAWRRPHFAAYLAAMVAGASLAAAWIAVLIHSARRIRRQARDPERPPAPPRSAS